METDQTVSRRSVLAVGAAAAGSVALVACGSDSGTTGAASTTPPSPTPSPTGSTAGAAGLIAVADVPVGGSAAATNAGAPVVVAQPKAGEVVAFSAICTHKGCTVNPDGAQLKCPCHGSVYDAFTGEVVSGPAPAPLPPVTVSVAKGVVVAT